MRYCDAMPPFQPSFTGYGKNKLTWSLQLLRMGYILKQLGSGFLVHYPHKDSNSRKLWNQRPDLLEPNMKVDEIPSDSVDWSIYKRGQVDVLYVEFKEWLLSGVKDEIRMPICDKFDDDNNLWVNK